MTDQRSGEVIWLDVSPTVSISSNEAPRLEQTTIKDIVSLTELYDEQAHAGPSEEEQEWNHVMVPLTRQSSTVERQRPVSPTPESLNLEATPEREEVEGQMSNLYNILSTMEQLLGRLSTTTLDFGYAIRQVSSQLEELLLQVEELPQMLESIMDRRESERLQLRTRSIPRTRQ